MPSAKPVETEKVLGIIGMYILFLLAGALFISFVVGMIKSIQCSTGPVNIYEHFQNTNDVNDHLFKSLNNMNNTFDTYTNKLQDTISQTSDMKSQTCSLYDSVRDKYIKSKAAEVADPSEYSAPASEQKKLQRTRANNAVNSWNDKIAVYQKIHNNTSMLDCASIIVTEGFQNYISQLPALAKRLEAKIEVFSDLLNTQSFKNWLSDCKGIKGTADYLNVYINNTQVDSEISKCKNDNRSSGKSDEEINNLCMQQYGALYENFQGYVNTQFSFPVPYPTSGMTPEQIGYYAILSKGQDLLAKYAKMVGTTYQDANAAYTRMNRTNQAYVAYNKKADDLSNKNYTAAEVQSVST